MKLVEFKSRFAALPSGGGASHCPHALPNLEARQTRRYVPALAVTAFVGGAAVRNRCTS